MSIYKHSIFRYQAGLSPRDEFLLSVIAENEGHKSTVIRNMWKVEGMGYTDMNFKKSLDKLISMQFVTREYTEKSFRCRFLVLTNTGREYIQLVKSFYA